MKRINVAAIGVLCSSLLAMAAQGATGPVGRMAGSASVSPSGIASYSIPIRVPEGIQGLSPKLSLNYSSTSALGMAGVGWSVGGGSSISRCGKQKAVDGAYDSSLTLSANDRLCLDGQRLLNGGASVNNQASGNGLDVVTVYTTELQGFKKITATLDATGKQPQVITVITKDGLTMVYGGTSDSRIVANVINPTAVTVSGAVVSWLLSSVTDVHGNTMTYSYTVDSVNSSAVLSSIQYGGNPSVTPGKPATAIINFDYVADTTVPYTYLAGAQVRTVKRLSVIRVNALAGSTSTELRRYTLNYRSGISQLSRRALLDNVVECDTYNGVQQCLPATSFTWNDSALNLSNRVGTNIWADTAGATGATSTDKGVITAGTANTWNGDQSYFTTIKYADLDADGRTDVCGRTSAGIQCYLSTGSGFSANAITGPAWGGSPWNLESSYSTIQMGDLNGDGKSDICGRDTTGFICYLSLGATGFDLAHPVTLTTDFSDAAGWGSSTAKYYYTIRLMDLDQDGRTDVCGLGATGLRCYYTRVNGTGGLMFSEATIYNQAGSTLNASNVDISFAVPTLMAMDFKDNNQTAVCARGALVDTSTNTLRTDGKLKCVIVLAKTNTASLVSTSDAFSSVSASLAGVASSRFVDVNGDGAADLCQGSVTIYMCYKNPGIGEDFLGAYFDALKAAYDSQSQTPRPPLPAHIWEQSTGMVSISAVNGPSITTTKASYLSSLQYLDVNKDGLTDVCQRTSSGHVCRMQQRVESSPTCVALYTKLTANNNPPTTAAQIQEVCAQSATNPVPYLYTGDGFLDVFKNRFDIPAWSDANGWDKPQYYLTISMVDINGDGFPDACARETTGLACYTSSTTPADLIGVVTDGFGMQTRFTYKPLTDASVYTKGNAAVYPDMDVQPAMWVVANVQGSDGVGGLRSTEYRYSGLKVNVDRGTLGFAAMEVRDQSSGKLTITNFRQDFPFTGAMTQVEQRYCPTAATASASCTLLQRSTTTWSQSQALPAPYTGILPYSTQNIEQFWEMPTAP